MTSPYARPDQSILKDLEHLLETLEQELGGWRARAQKAEQDLAAIGPGKGKGGAHTGQELVQARHRISLLESENAALRQRIDFAKEHLERLRTRLRFVEDHGAGDAA